MLQQFSVARIEQQLVVVLTNTLFHNIEVLLVAVVKPQTNAALLTQFQIPVTFDEQACFIDLLDIASVSAKRLKATAVDLQIYRQQIKAGLDLLIDGF
ncbi:CcdB family protein [Rheinheimera sp. NSM]|uniref:CcdB family protein n=1 Tax=Rheinheimera sp. NSM TaxID=3457884 RepID=UPI004037087D